MKSKIRYICYLIVIICFSIFIPGTFTNSKYYTSVDVEKKVNLANSIFVLSKVEAEPDIYTIKKGESVVAHFNITNIDENNYINNIEMNYYLSLEDDNENSVAIKMDVDNYSFVEEKGYGPILLAYDGQTLDSQDLTVNFCCPADYLGDNDLNYDLKVYAENVQNNDLTVTKKLEIKSNIVDEESSLNNLNNTVNFNSNLINLQNEILLNENNKKINIDDENNIILEIEQDQKNNNNEIINTEQVKDVINNEKNQEEQSNQEQLESTLEITSVQEMPISNVQNEVNTVESEIALDLEIEEKEDELEKSNIEQENNTVN